jgi:putative glutamine amidotransferase
MPARALVTQRVHDVAGRAERRDALDQQWAPFLAQLGLLAVPVPNLLPDPGALVEAVEPVLLVLTGGNDLAHLEGAQQPAPERDRTERALLAAARAARLPVLGVCRGMQMMVVDAGGRLVPVQDHVARPHPVAAAPGAPARWTVRTGTVNSFHDWGVPADGLGRLVALAHAPDGTVEAACDPELPQVCVMWHPERDPRDPADLALVDALVRAAP